MNGPQHYLEAERLLRGVTWENEQTREAEAKVRLAQAHAALALVAVQVDAAGLDTLDIHGTEQATDWGRATQAAPQ